MVESRTRKSRTYFLLGVWLTWTVIAALSYARHSVEDNHLGSSGNLLGLLTWLSCFYPWALLTPAIFWIEARFPFTAREWKQRVAVLVFASLIFSYLKLQVSVLLDAGINYSFGRPVSLSGFPWQIPRIEFYFEEFFFWCTLAAGCAIRNFAEFHQQARRATQLALEKSQLEASLRQAELETLRMRLNPHFLFNSLQNISVLAQRDSKLASQMLTRLGDLLRAALRRNLSPETTVKDEIALTQDYLAVEKMRFGGRLNTLVEIEPEVEQALMPTFLLQPLVENAVIHGLRGISHTGIIEMRALKQGDRLVLIVADNGVGVPANFGSNGNVGIGLSSTRDRLTKTYPGEHDFMIQKLDQGGTEVRISIPFRQRDPHIDHSEEIIPSEQPATVDC